MSSPNIRIFPGLKEVSEGAAERILEMARRAAAQGRTVAIACSGGQTPRELYRLLASDRYAGSLCWDSVHLFQVDERCVAPDDEQSNYRMMREALLDRVPQAAARFHRIAAERPDHEAVANEYAEEIRRTLQPRAGGWPRFDLILLGMGGDGHTASLFPGTAALRENRRWVTPNYVPRLNASRITLTFPVLNAAAEAIFLAVGEDKAERLKEVLEGPAGRYPSQQVQLASGGLWWYIDEAAGRLLSHRGRNQR